MIEVFGKLKIKTITEEVMNTEKPILLEDEPVYVKEKGFKIGDGIRTIDQLPYAAGGIDVYKNNIYHYRSKEYGDDFLTDVPAKNAIHISDNQVLSNGRLGRIVHLGANEGAYYSDINNVYIHNFNYGGMTVIVALRHINPAISPKLFNLGTTATKFYRDIRVGTILELESLNSADIDYEFPTGHYLVEVVSVSENSRCTPVSYTMIRETDPMSLDTVSITFTEGGQEGRIHLGKKEGYLQFASNDIIEIRLAGDKKKYLIVSNGGQNESDEIKYVHAFSIIRGTNDLTDFYDKEVLVSRSIYNNPTWGSGSGSGSGATGVGMDNLEV